jgi:hypothetical protein
MKLQLLVPFRSSGTFFRGTRVATTSRSIKGRSPKLFKPNPHKREAMPSSKGSADYGGNDSGDTAFIIICGALVLLMALPGIVLFYGR